MNEKNAQVRVHVIFEPDEVQAIDDYSFKARIRTRSEAIRTLIRKGLESEDHEKINTETDK